MPFEALEDKRMYRRAEGFCDGIWEFVIKWDRFAKGTVGTQLVEAADSIGAYIAEAGGRFHPADVAKFLYYSRGSLRETKFWLRRANQRGLIDSSTVQRFDSELEQLSREVNLAIRFQKARKSNG